MPMMWGYYDNGGMIVWAIISSLFWLGLAAVAVWALVRWVNRPSRPATPPASQQQQGPAQPSAMDILKMRYARGEIDAATFQQMRAELEASEKPSVEYPEAIPTS